MASETVQNAVKLVSEGVVLPGTSLLLDGDFKAGAGHAVVGLLARAVFGPLGWFFVAADSYSKSTTGKSLIEQFKSEKARITAAVKS